MKRKCWRASRSNCVPSCFSSGTESVEQASATSAASEATRALEERLRIEASHLPQRLGDMLQDREHRSIDRLVVHDRDVVAVRKLEEVVLDLLDRLEVLEVVVRRARALAPARREASPERLLVERRHHQEDHVRGLLIGGQ